MKPGRKRLLFTLLIVAIALWILGALAGPFIQNSTTLQQRADNAILGGISFILIFIGIVVAFVDLIIFLATKLNNNVRESVYRPILNILIAGIVLGVIGMFQPFVFELYQIGFVMLFFSLIGFMAWSHLVPKGVQRGAEVGAVSISAIEKLEAGGTAGETQTRPAAGEV